MSLRARFLLLAAVLVVLASVSAWLVFHRIAEGIIEEWGRRIAEVQVQYDSARLRQPLEREIALARQFADSIVLQRWARNPDDPVLEAEAIEEMESFRGNFGSRSYFVALRENGAYYHNNADGEYTGEQLRYYLDRDDPEDAWFFRLIEEGRDFHLNVNPDTELGVTKLWIDVLLRDSDGTILGMVGTGLGLEQFLDEIVDIEQEGITTLFLDFQGAIQLYRDQRMIDFASIVKPEGQKKTVDLLLDAPEDERRIQAMMDALAERAEPNGTVRTTFVSIDGTRHLAGLAYLPTIGWYELTLLDLHSIMPVSRFAPVAAVFAVALLVTLLAFHLALQYQILNPLRALETAMRRGREGRLEACSLPRGHGEIGRLIQHFQAMAEAIRSHTEELEHKVRERTEALHRLARIDPLTELINRRGMTELLEEAAARATREGQPFGLIWLDLDRFKELNDQRGHSAGDAALCEIAQLLRDNTRRYDHAARWGGDEFLVLLSPCDAETLRVSAERIRAAVEAARDGIGEYLTVSIGAYLAQPGEGAEAALSQADRALYAAKSAGRNTFRLAE